MFVLNDDNSIYITRGDIAYFSVCAQNNGANHKFKAGDALTMKIYGRNDAKKVVMSKDFPVTQETEEVEIFLSKTDTTIGEIISRPIDYWYEIVLNDATYPQTLIGYDVNGPKVFRLFPEGGDIA